MAELSVADLTVGEGDGFVDIVVKLDQVVGSAVTVNYTTSNWTATSGSGDYGAVSGALTFAPGETVKTVRVTLPSNGIVEAQESFNFVLSSPVNATLAEDGIASVTIIDNDTVRSTPDIFVRDVVVDEKAGTASFVVTLGRVVGQSSNSTVTVNYTTADGTAVAGSDYLAQSGTLSFAPGQSTKTVLVSLVDDGTPEGNEFFSLNLSSPTNATIADGTARATIGVSDTAPLSQPQLIVSDMTVGEGDNYVDVVVSLSTPGLNVVTVNYTTSNWTATSGSGDYEAVAGTLTFALGETTKTVRVELPPNGIVEAQESFRFVLGSPVNATLAEDGIASITVIDDDTVRSTPDIFVRDVVVDERAGTASFVVTLGRVVGQSSNSTVTVGYATADGTAVAGSDYVAQSGTLSFAPGESTKTVFVNLVDDGTPEGSEFFSLNLSSPTNATIADGTARATIGVSDTAPLSQPQLIVSDMTVGEDDRYVDVVVSLSTPGLNVVTVNYTTSNWSATSGSGDYEAVAGTLTFALGETTKTVRVELPPNGIAEAQESFRFVLGSPVNATLAKDGIATITVIDDDTVRSTPDIFVRDVVVDEKAGTASFVVTLGRAVGQSSISTVTVDYATADGTAVAGSDYVAQSGSLRFAPGESTKTVTVNLIDDDAAEGLERFNLVLGNATNGVILDANGTAEIGANDALPVNLPLVSVAARTASEADGHIDIMFSLSAPTQSRVTVNYATANDTAVGNGNDYQSTSGTVVFAPGETTQSVRIELVNNTIVEGTELFRLDLSSPSNATIATPSVSMTIVDNDAAGVVVLSKGRSDDTYEVTALSDVIVEEAEGGTDTVDSFLAAYTLGENIENARVRLGGAASLTGNARANVLTGGGGNDTLTGGEGDDVLIGGAGVDVAIFGAARAQYTVTIGANSATIVGPDGSDWTAGIEELRFTDQSIQLSDLNAPFVAGPGPGTAATNLAVAANIAVNFSEAIVRGNGTVFLKTSADQLVATYDAASSSNLSISGSVLTINPSADLDYSTGYRVEFAAGTLQDLAGNGNAAGTSYGFTTFNIPQYVASYADLIQAFGLNLAAATVHYVNAGRAEGRTASFDALRYIASNPDLVNFFGLDTAAATTHYIGNGYAEGRQLGFDALRYIASNPDLIAYFGLNTTAATTHYIANGYAEGRQQGFDALRYIASNPDLIAFFGLNTTAATTHYIANGYAENRQIGFDALRYIASNPDLIAYFGLNTTEATTHYIANGYAEGRVIDFNAASYLAQHADLQAAFGNDLVAATRHYISNGAAEGRQWRPQAIFAPQALDEAQFAPQLMALAGAAREPETRLADRIWFEVAPSGEGRSLSTHDFSMNDAWILPATHDVAQDWFSAAAGTRTGWVFGPGREGQALAFSEAH